MRRDYKSKTVLDEKLPVQRKEGEQVTQVSLMQLLDLPCELRGGRIPRSEVRICKRLFEELRK